MQDKRKKLHGINAGKFLSCVCMQSVLQLQVAEGDMDNVTSWWIHSRRSWRWAQSKSFMSTKMTFSANFRHGCFEIFRSLVRLCDICVEANVARQNHHYWVINEESVPPVACLHGLYVSTCIGYRLAVFGSGSWQNFVMTEDRLLELIPSECLSCNSKAHCRHQNTKHCTRLCHFLRRNWNGTQSLLQTETKQNLLTLVLRTRALHLKTRRHWFHSGALSQEISFNQKHSMTLSLHHIIFIHNYTTINENYR